MTRRYVSGYVGRFENRRRDFYYLFSFFFVSFVLSSLLGAFFPVQFVFILSGIVALLSPLFLHHIINDATKWLYRELDGPSTKRKNKEKAGQ